MIPIHSYNYIDKYAQHNGVGQCYECGKDRAFAEKFN